MSCFVDEGSKQGNLTGTQEQRRTWELELIQRRCRPASVPDWLCTPPGTLLGRT